MDYFLFCIQIHYVKDKKKQLFIVKLQKKKINIHIITLKTHDKRNRFRTFLELVL